MKLEKDVEVGFLATFKSRGGGGVTKKKKKKSKETNLEKEIQERESPPFSGSPYYLESKRRRPGRG